MINWVGYIPAVLLVSLIPGASQLLGFRNAVFYGLPRAMLGLLGRLAAFAIFIALVSFGLGAVLTRSAHILIAVKFAGCAYLVWLGFVLLRRSFTEDYSAYRINPAASRRVIGQEFVVAISNPKAILLFAALLPQFANHGALTLGQQLLLLGGVYLIIETVVTLGYAAVGTRIGDSTGLTPRSRRRLDRTTSGCFIALAGYLVAASS